MSQQRTYYSEDAKQRAQAKTTAVVAICLALGATIGTAIAVLFAPQSGDQTRDELASTVDNQLAQGREATDSAIERLQEQVSRLQERLEDMVS